MMKRLAFTLLLAFIGSTVAARGDVLAVRQNIAAPGGDQQVEVTTYLAENDQDRSKITQNLKDELGADLQKNPELVTGFEFVTTDSPNLKDTQPEAPIRESLEKIAGKREIVTRKLSADATRSIQKNFLTWNERAYKISLVTTRTLINGGVTAYSVMVSQHIPFELGAASGALLAGGIVGAMSGTAQHFNAALGTYLTKSIAKKWIKPGATQKFAMKLEPFMRWYLLELGFVIIAQSAMTAIGYGPRGDFTDIASATAVAALGALAAQGFWDVAISKVTKKKIASAASKAVQKQVQLRADLIALGLSALSVSGMIGKLQELPIANWQLGAMAVTGAAYFVKVNYRDWICRRNLKKVASQN